MFDKLTNKNTIPNISYKRQGFLTNFIGFKYLFLTHLKKRKKLIYTVGKLISSK